MQRGGLYAPSVKIYSGEYGLTLQACKYKTASASNAWRLGVVPWLTCVVKEMRFHVSLSER